ncbi:MAG: 2Fe-2S iron-sulfur cluster binding domain-containing protein, partial [Actinobacteria bacterium]
MRATSTSSVRSSSRTWTRAAVRSANRHRCTTCRHRSRSTQRVPQRRCLREPRPRTLWLRATCLEGARSALGATTIPSGLWLRATRWDTVSSAETVKLTIDGVAVEVPRGTGLVEAALAAGIEIPVFCYEPRLGAPVGACRMCLCEVEPGPPKPQAACTLTAQDGMVVQTALTSPVAAEAQNATLEFTLVNHPLDCPVCDKGGECPLQDLTFRYGL